MLIVLVGPGIMPIPPIGWGAVEVLIFDYYKELKKLGHNIKIINTPDQQKIIDNINQLQPDFVHIHYDCFVDIIPKLKTQNKSKIAITSHYPFISTRPDHDYQIIFDKLISYTNQGLCYIFALTMKDILAFTSAGCDKNRIFLTPNGVSEDNIKFRIKAKTSKSIYLAKIEPRKRQHLTYNLKNIDYYGKQTLGYHLPPNNYHGEMSREEVHNKLTYYSSLILLSESESDPLVVKEGLMAGLKIILSQNCGHQENEFISIVEESKINNSEYIESRLINNDTHDRQAARNYAIENFGWKNIIQRYIQTIELTQK